MRELVLLPGWGFDPRVLTPLATVLSVQLRVRIEPLPECEPERWLDELDARLPAEAWLGGWSLGGMLAVELAARRGPRCPGVLSMASNACFVARADWPDAMPAATFAAFREGCARDAAATLRRFAMLCAKGSADARALGRQLSADLSSAAPGALLAALELLARLDTRPALQRFTGRQLHLFGADDALVPAQAAQALGALGQTAVVLERAGHAFPLECAAQAAALIQDFLGEAGDD